MLGSARLHTVGLLAGGSTSGCKDSVVPCFPHPSIICPSIQLAVLVGSRGVDSCRAHPMLAVLLALLAVLAPWRGSAAQVTGYI